MNYHGATPRPDNDDDVRLEPGTGIELMGKVFVVQSRSTNPPGYIVADSDCPGMEQKLLSRDMAKDEFGMPIGVRESLRRRLRWRQLVGP